ncbi:MAG: FAD:protein FMN transferase [Clostridia bacterium]|nr:FAD:protein FMN transferase [Clostridia bacterium]
MLKRTGCFVLSLLLLAVGLAGCASFSAVSPHKTVWLDLFDTVSSLTVYGVDKADFEAGAKALHTRLTEYHQLFDIYHSYAGVNNLKTVNDNAGQPVAVPSEVLDLLEYGVSAYRRTGGRVNILFGAVLELWHDCRVTALETPVAALPEPAALQTAATHTDPAALVIDREAGTACLTDPLARLDVGAVAKGYAAELAATYIREELGWTSALLDMGGNVRAIGGKPTIGGQTPFTIGVQNPNTDSANAYLLTVGLQDMAAVTSGDYQRFFMVDGRQYAHIIDPDTLYPAAFVRAVTVVCPDSGLADVLSTALFTLPVEQGLALLRQFPEAQAVWVLTDGTLQYSDGFNAYKK